MSPDSINSALMLLAVGMTTVFVVLLLVVITGNTLIRIVNFITTNNSKDDVISPATVAAITAAVEVTLEGKGHITGIEKTK